MRLHLSSVERGNDVHLEVPGRPRVELDPVPHLARLDEALLREDHVRACGARVVGEHELVVLLVVAHLGRLRQRESLERVAERDVEVLDREDVGEVVAELEGELERDCLSALVLDVQAILHPFAHEAVPTDRDHVLRELARERIAEEVGGGVVLGFPR